MDKIKAKLKEIANLPKDFRRDMMLIMANYFKNYGITELKDWVKEFEEKKVYEPRIVDMIENNNQIRKIPDIECENGHIFIYQHYEGERKLVKQIPLNYNIKNRIWNQENKKISYFGIETNSKSYTLLDTFKIRSILKDNGGTNKHIQLFLNYLALTDEIKNIQTINYFGFYPKNNSLKFPPQFIATTITGHGVEFFEKFYNNKNTFKEGKKTWFNILRTAEKGIGTINALMIGAFSIASLFQKYYKKTNNIVPLLFLLGPVESGKTPAAKYIGCITKYPCLHTDEELTPAIFSQLGSMGSFPLVIDEADNLNPDIQNKTKVIATSDIKRRRSNKNGSAREAPEFVRTLILTGNNIPDFMLNSQATLDRTIFIIIDNKPKNLRDWTKTVKEFNNTKESIVNFLIHKKIDFNQLIEENLKEIENLEAAYETKLSNRKRGIFEYFCFGIKLLKKIDYFDENYIIDNILDEIREKINESRKIANEEMIENLRTYLREFEANYYTFIKMKDVNEDVLSEGQKLTREMQMNRAKKECISWSSYKNDNKYWIITLKECNEMYKRNRLDAFKGLTNLERMLKSYSINTFQQSARHKIFEKKIVRALWISDDIFEKDNDEVE